MKKQQKAVWQNEKGERLELLIEFGEHGLSDSFFVFTDESGNQVKLNLLSLLPPETAEGS